MTTEAMTQARKRLLGAYTNRRLTFTFGQSPIGKSGAAAEYERTQPRCETIIVKGGPR